MILVLIGSFFLLLSVNPGYLSHGDVPAREAKDPDFLSADSAWVDSIMGKMSLEDKIAQMLMIQAYSNRGEDHIQEINKLISRFKIGGLIFFQGTPARQARMTNSFQARSEIPLLIAMDAEWGLGFRLDNVISYPRQMVLGAIQDDSLIYQLGREMAWQLKDLGVHMNFAPVADINNNPENPVIHTRSFGEDRELVSNKVNALFQGMQSEGLLVTAKHFPGHGDTNVDSHYALPVISHDRSRLDSIELYPFRKAIPEGLSGIMIAHLQVPELDNRENRPSSLSKLVVTDLLKKELGFKGLIVSDAMNMKGVSTNFEPVNAEIEALLAGNDILLMPSDVPSVIQGIRRAVRRDEIPLERIDESCRKILLAKAYLGLDTIKPVSLESITDRLNDRKYLALQEKLIENAITLVRDSSRLIPLKHLEKLQLATMNIGTEKTSPFSRTLDKYAGGEHYFYPDPEDLPGKAQFKERFSRYNTIIISLYYTRSYGNNYDIPPGIKEYINSIDFDGKLILNLFGYPYALGVLGEMQNMDAIVLSYTQDSLNQVMAAQAMFGGIALKGRLPVSVNEEFKLASGISTDGGTRLNYGSPESVSMNYDTLSQIDEIIEEALVEKAFPGCQVLVARKGRVVWQKAYGYHDYRRRQKVQNEDLYDLASITKIASTIPSLMRLQDQGKFNVDSTLGAYFPGIDTSKKAKLPIRDILTHQAGLQAWIPFYTSTLEPLDTSENLFSTNFNYTYPYRIGPAAYANRNIVYKDSIFNKEYTEFYPVRVAEDFFIRADFRDSIYRKILESPLGDKKYLYSDLGYYFLYKSVEELTDSLFYTYNWFNFYGPLGAETLGFLPLNRFDRSQIVPTEYDRVFRRQLIWGHVHDPGAAMLGGIAGHAGLFSNANDLAKLMQMYLNNGSYGGRTYIDSATLAEYTRCQYCEDENRRGIGFDRPITEEDDAGPACDSASELSYGHSGFTGTIAWLDPEYDLLYIFLSNRIHPNQDNFKLITLNVRTNIQQKIYNSIEDK